jgi:hypothetical protein
VCCATAAGTGEPCESLLRVLNEGFEGTGFLKMSAPYSGHSGVELPGFSKNDLEGGLFYPKVFVRPPKGWTTRTNRPPGREFSAMGLPAARAS